MAYETCMNCEWIEKQRIDAIQAAQAQADFVQTLHDDPDFRKQAAEVEKEAWNRVDRIEMLLKEHRRFYHEMGGKRQ